MLNNTDTKFVARFIEGIPFLARLGFNNESREIIEPASAAEFIDQILDQNNSLRNLVANVLRSFSDKSNQSANLYGKDPARIFAEIAQAIKAAAKEIDKQPFKFTMIQLGPFGLQVGEKICGYQDLVALAEEIDVLNKIRDCLNKSPGSNYGMEDGLIEDQIKAKKLSLEGAVIRRFNNGKWKFDIAEYFIERGFTKEEIDDERKAFEDKQKGNNQTEDHRLEEG